ncbi:MAG: triple tyrosine motif-containing protein [Bacteroidota bacterium]
MNDLSVGKFLCVLFILTLSSFTVYPQDAAGERPSIHGSPRVVHYTRKDFNSDPQIWTMCQDKEGILYFGSNNGVLIYDGEVWQNVKLPNNSSVRSLLVNKQGTVYAGGFNEFGRIRKDDYGQYFYESLFNLLRVEDRNIENIWSIHEVQGYIVFRSYKLLIALRNNKAVTLPATTLYDYAAVLDEKLYVKDGEEINAIDLTSLEITRVIRPQALKGETFLCLLPGYRSHRTLVITRQGSVFDLDVESGSIHNLQRVIDPHSSNRVTSAIKTSTGNYYFGTLSSKVISLNNLGEQASGREVFHELQDNTVHHLFESNEGNIWALLNNGIDCIDVSSPVTKLMDNASILDVLTDKYAIYLATNQGIFISPLEGRHSRLLKKDFKSLPGLEGAAWSLQQFEDQVLCSHDEGLFVLSRGTYKKIPGPRGIWKTIAIRDKPGHYLVCSYDGIFLMRYDQKKGFEILHKIEGFNESSRDILQSSEPGVFWVCHGYKGVFRIKIDASFQRVVGLEHFKDKNGLPSPFNINVFRWNKQIVFTTNKGIFTYNESKNRFQPHPFLSELFGTGNNVRQLIEFGDKTWFVHGDEVGYFMNKSESPTLIKGLFLQLKGTLNESMECIRPVNSNNVLIGTREGLYAFDLAYNAFGKDHRTVITGVDYQVGAEVTRCRLNDGLLQPLPHQTTHLRFHFSVPGFDDKTNIQYSFKVDGLDLDWSPWQESSFKEFSFLQPGTYTFHVQARSLLGEKATEATFAFKIIPVWYKTTWAYALYLILALLIVFMIMRWVQRRINFVRQKTLAEEEKKRKVLQLEIERIKLEREKEQMAKDKELLEEDVIFKSKELANYTMLLVKKRELLGEMSEDLKILKDMVKNDQARQSVRELQRKISSNLQSEEHLKVFEANFERVHHTFFAHLKSSFPDLSSKELQLCAFVKMNLTNKEIASILNLSVRGIETARYRLRKRLGIDRDEDMAGFLDKLYYANGASVHT